MNIRKYKNFEPKIDPTAYVDPQSTVIGQVELAEDTSVWPAAVVRGDYNYIKVGARSNIQDGAVFHVVPDHEYYPKEEPINVGEDVTIGHGAILHGCTVGDRCLIGMNATLLDGSVVEDDVIVAANTLVPPGKTLESGFLYVGSPAKQARPLKPEEKELIVNNAALYVELKNDYMK